MTIKEIYEAEESLKGFSTTGKVFWLGPAEEFTAKKSGKKFSVTKFGISDGSNKDTDSIYCSIYSDQVPSDFAVGVEADFLNCAIRSYTNKEGKEKRELQVGEIAPKGAVVEEKPKVETKAPEKKEEMLKSDWELKDLRVARMAAIKDESFYVQAVSTVTAALVNQKIVGLEEKKLEEVMTRIHDQLKKLGEIDRKEFTDFVWGKEKKKE